MKRHFGRVKGRPCSVAIVHWLVLVMGTLVLGDGLAARAADLFQVETGSQPTEWTLKYKNQPVLVYAFAPQKCKPYIKALHTLRGDNVLRDSPFDHLHHHALMYGIKVNGVNFWEETAGAGVQKVVSMTPPQPGQDPAGRPQASFSQVIHWLAPGDVFLPDTNSTPLLVERRTLTLTVDEAQQEVAVRWRSQFEVGAKTNEVTLTGANYHGLGMRFQQDLDPVAVHLTAEGKPDLAGNRQDVSAHGWEAVCFDSPQKPATLALFGSAANVRGPARFFAMRTPFAYLSATQGLDQEPLVYHRGDRFELNYLVTLYPQLKSPAALSERAVAWEQSLSAPTR